MSDDSTGQGSGEETTGQGSESGQAQDSGKTGAKGGDEGSQGGTGSKTGGDEGSGTGGGSLPSEEEFKKYDPDRALTTLRAQRAEEKRLKDQATSTARELEEARTKLQQYEEKNQTEEQKREKADAAKDKKISDLEADNSNLRAIAKRSGFIDATRGILSPAQSTMAYRLSDDVGVELEYDDKYRVTNLDAYLDAVRKQFPEEFGIAGVNGGEREGRGGGQTDMNSAIRSAVGL